MPIDPRIPLGYEPAQYIDPRQLREQRIAEQAQQRQAQVQEMQLREQERQIAEQQAFREALARGARPDELARISVTAAASYQKVLADQRKAQLDQEKEQLAIAGTKAARFASIAGSVRDQQTLQYGVAQALREGLIAPEHAKYAMEQGYTPEIQQWLRAQTEQAMSIAEMATAQRDAFDRQMRTAADQRQQAAEARSVQQFAVEQPGRVADAAIKQMNAAGQAVSGVQSQDQYDSWRASLPPEIQRRVPVMYSPSAVAIVQRMAMTPAQVANMQQSQATAAEAVRHNRATEANTVRGQNMADARGKLADERMRTLAAARANARPASGPELRAYGFYARAADAEKVLTELQPNIVDKGYFGQLRLKYAPNAMQDDTNQAYMQAQRQFTEARLRKDSGAAIADSEYEKDAITYFPQPGDSEATLKRKAAARKVVLDALRREAGRAVQADEEEPMVDPWVDFSFEEVK